MTSKMPAIKGPDGAVVEWENFEYEPLPDGTENIQPAQATIKLIQTTIPSDLPEAQGHNGEFHFSDTGEFHKTVRVVPLRMTTGRSIFEQGGDAPLCRSDDGYAPRPNGELWSLDSINTSRGTVPVPATEPATCAECPLSQWGSDGSPPPCGEQLSFMVEREDGEPSMFRVKGSGMKAVNAFLRNKIRRGKPPMSAYIWTLGSEFKQPSKNIQFYELTLSAAAMTPKQHEPYAERVRELARRFSNPQLGEGGDEQSWDSVQD